MFSEMESAKKQKIYLAIGLAVVAGAILIFIGLYSSKKGNEPFRFEAGSGADRSLSLRADRYRADSGFFGLFGGKEIHLENAYLDLYGVRLQEGPAGLSLKNILSEESFNALPVKGIAVIRAKPIAVKIHDNQETPTQIFANTGAIRIKERDILLTGDVRVLSEPYLLLTDKLTFLPETGRLQAAKYVMRTSDQRIEGDQITTDIFLKPVK
ncbi:MAG TPA: hypothetical protein PLM69_07125 [Syntrophales bacterium]|jgi:hypothetical protein|nr:hypothetical protein [Syntrophales bacterium]HPC33150.1 hypothetical protein [Syntrophales bacterium]